MWETHIQQILKVQKCLLARGIEMILACTRLDCAASHEAITTTIGGRAMRI